MELLPRTDVGIECGGAKQVQRELGLGEQVRACFDWKVWVADCERGNQMVLCRSHHAFGNVTSMSVRWDQAWGHIEAAHQLQQRIGQNVVEDLEDGEE
jgi:hypothetical protein